MSQTRTLSGAAAVRFEPGTSADSYAVFLIFERAYGDLTRRQGIAESTSIDDPEALARTWAVRRSMYHHLAATADQFWLAKRDDEILGFARSIVREGLRLLTEFFVLPDEQSSGLGHELLSLALPDQGSARRWLLATLDLRAQTLYLRHGLHTQFPVYYFWREPRRLTQRESDLVVEAVRPSLSAIQAVSDIDRQSLEHRRDVDHQWLMSDRQGRRHFGRKCPWSTSTRWSICWPAASGSNASWPSS